MEFLLKVITINILKICFLNSKCTKAVSWATTIRPRCINKTTDLNHQHLESTRSKKVETKMQEGILMEEKRISWLPQKRIRCTQGTWTHPTLNLRYTLLRAVIEWGRSSHPQKVFSLPWGFGHRIKRYRLRTTVSVILLSIWFPKFEFCYENRAIITKGPVLLHTRVWQPQSPRYVSRSLDY